MEPSLVAMWIVQTVPIVLLNICYEIIPNNKVLEMCEGWSLLTYQTTCKNFTPLFQLQNYIENGCMQSTYVLNLVSSGFCHVLMLN